MTTKLNNKIKRDIDNSFINTNTLIELALPISTNANELCTFLTTDTPNKHVIMLTDGYYRSEHNAISFTSYLIETINKALSTRLQLSTFDLDKTLCDIYFIVKDTFKDKVIYANNVIDNSIFDLDWTHTSIIYSKARAYENLGLNFNFITSLILASMAYTAKKFISVTSIPFNIKRIKQDIILNVNVLVRDLSIDKFTLNYTKAISTDIKPIQLINTVNITKRTDMSMHKVFMKQISKLTGKGAKTIVYSERTTSNFLNDCLRDLPNALSLGNKHHVSRSNNEDDLSNDYIDVTNYECCMFNDYVFNQYDTIVVNAKSVNTLSIKNTYTNFNLVLFFRDDNIASLLKVISMFNDKPVSIFIITTSSLFELEESMCNCYTAYTKHTGNMVIMDTLKETYGINIDLSKRKQVINLSKTERKLELCNWITNAIKNGDKVMFPKYKKSVKYPYGRTTFVLTKAAILNKLGK